MAVAQAAIQRGIGVFKPVADGQRCDFVFDVGHRLLRVQCKSALRRGDVIFVQCHSSRRDRSGFSKRSYNELEIDVIAAYCADVDRCYLLPPDLFAGRPYVQLRLAPTRNKQTLGINWAHRFEFGAVNWCETAPGP